MTEYPAVAALRALDERLRLCTGHVYTDEAYDSFYQELVSDALASPPVAVQEEGDAKKLRPLAAGLPEVDGLLCLTFCDDPAVPYPWRVQQWMAARNCWENEWYTFGKGKGKRWISHWMPVEELKP